MRSVPEGFVDTVARYYGQFSTDMKQTQQAVDEIDRKQHDLDGKQSAASHLVHRCESTRSALRVPLRSLTIPAAP